MSEEQQAGNHDDDPATAHENRPTGEAGDSAFEGSGPGGTSGDPHRVEDGDHGAADPPIPAHQTATMGSPGWHQEVLRRLTTGLGPSCETLATAAKRTGTTPADLCARAVAGELQLFVMANEWELSLVQSAYQIGGDGHPRRWQLSTGEDHCFSVSGPLRLLPSSCSAPLAPGGGQVRQVEVLLEDKTWRHALLRQPRDLDLHDLLVSRADPSNALAPEIEAGQAPEPTSSNGPDDRDLTIGLLCGLLAAEKKGDKYGTFAKPNALAIAEALRSRVGSECDLGGNTRRAFGSTSTIRQVRLGPGIRRLAAVLKRKSAPNQVEEQ